MTQGPDLERRVHHLENEDSAIYTELFEFRADVRAWFEEADLRFARIEDRLDKLEQRMDKLEQRMDKLEQRMDKIEGLLEEILRRLPA